MAVWLVFLLNLNIVRDYVGSHRTRNMQRQRRSENYLSKPRKASVLFVKNDVLVLNKFYRLVFIVGHRP